MSEKITRALPRVKCPHPLEPHQIQGLNYVHIFPVVQWLVKKAIETREEMSDYIRTYAESQFSKDRRTPHDAEAERAVLSAADYLGDVNEHFHKKRQLRAAAASHVTSRRRFADATVIASQVDRTLLEYGHRFAGAVVTQAKDKEAQEANKEAMEEERRRIEEIQKQLLRVDADGRVGRSIIEGILGQDTEQIMQLASDLARVQAELAANEQQRMGGLQAHKRDVASLERQIAQQDALLAETTARHDAAMARLNEYQAAANKAIKYNARVIRETNKLDELETPENAPILKILRALVAKVDGIAEHEAEFRASCKRQMEDMKERIRKLEADASESAEDGELQQIQAINAQYDADFEKLQKIRKLLSKKKREIAQIERLTDEVPSRAELAQYQKRFLELYTQVASKLVETRQYYNLYNTLDTSRLYYTREVSLLNSIFDNFEKAKASKQNQEIFIGTLDTMLKNAREFFTRVEVKRNEEFANREACNVKYLQLVEQQRQYLKLVVDFQEACRVNEELQAELSR